MALAKGRVMRQRRQCYTPATSAATVEESIGRRSSIKPTVALSPVARTAGLIGRRPIRNVGTLEIEQVVP